MKFLIVLIFLIGLATGKRHRLFIDSNVVPLSDEMVNTINSLGTSWKAGKTFYSLSEVKRRLGTKLGSSRHLHTINHEIDGDLPTTFDAREAWANCSSIRLIRDQGDCGSCYVFGSVEAMSDRLCIASKGSVQVDLSAEDPLACCSSCGDCNGGYPSKVWSYYASNGIVSGGLYHGKGCEPYTIAPTGLNSAHDTPKCTKTCVSGYGKSYQEDKHFGKKPYNVRGVKQIMKEIITNGPVTADFTVYADFPNYESGVYQQTSQKELGGHAIKILGWGTEDGVDYWLAANSWNTSWGEKGYFKIKRGSNECGIEDDIVAGLPEL